MLKKARLALEKSKNALREAKIAFNSRETFSEEFLSSNFPLDTVDRHYYYCVICGYSGDLICCDGCPNVYHAVCLGLTDIPDNDWFCSKCSKKIKSDNKVNE